MQAWKPLQIAVLAVGGAALASAAAAQSIGCMRMPSTLAQYVGCGYGAGHHAPIVRTPLQRPERMQRMMIVAPCEGPFQPAAYAPIGCYGGVCGMQDGWEHPAAYSITPTLAAPQPAISPPAPVGAASPPPAIAAPQAVTPAPPDRSAWRMVLP